MKSAPSPNVHSDPINFPEHPVKMSTRTPSDCQRVHGRTVKTFYRRSHTWTPYDKSCENPLGAHGLGAKRTLRLLHLNFEEPCFANHGRNAAWSGTFRVLKLQTLCSIPRLSNLRTRMLRAREREVLNAQPGTMGAS